MSLTAMITFDGIRRHFTLHQLVLRNDRGIGRPLVRAIHVPIPFGQAIHHLLQGRFVTAPTFPVQQLPGVPIQGLPDPELLAFVLEIMPHLIEFQDDRSPCGLWLLLVLLGKGPDPVEHSLG